MRKAPVFIHRIPELVQWFFDFTEINLNKLESNHPILKHFEEYEKWWKDTFQKKPEDFDSISARIIDFASFIKGVQVFQRQIEGKIKGEFVSDLLNNCYSVFFEIKVLMHFYIFGYENVIYRDNNVNGKHPDIMFTDKNLRRIFVECTRKYAKPERCADDTLLIEDLIRSVKLKAEEYKNLNIPFVYAVHVPEEIELDRDKFRRELGTRLQEMFKESIFKNVNWVVFSSYKLPAIKSIGIKEDVLFDTDLQRLQYPNGSVDPKLWVDVIW